MSSLFAALGFGLRRQKKGKTLDVWFPNIYFSTEDMPELFEICQPQAGKNAFYPLAFEQLKRLWDIYPDLLFGNLSIEPPSEHAYAQTDMGFFFLISSGSACRNTRRSLFQIADDFSAPCEASWSQP